MLLELLLYNQELVKYEYDVMLQNSEFCIMRTLIWKQLGAR